MPDFVDFDSREMDLHFMEAEANRLEKEISAAAGSFVEMPAEKVRELCDDALDGITAYRALMRKKEIDRERERWLAENKPGWLGRLFGRKPPEPPSDEWVFEHLCGNQGWGASVFGAEAARRVANRLRTACDHAEAVRVSARELEKLDTMREWSPAWKQRKKAPYR